SGGSGRPVGTSQNWHERVHVPPRIMIVSACRFQHSPMLGHDALSHTVCRPNSATRFLRSKKTSPEGIFMRIQLGFGWKRSLGAGASTAPVVSRIRSLRD